jgi:hypothetical protein
VQLDNFQKIRGTVCKRLSGVLLPSGSSGSRFTGGLIKVFSPNRASISISGTLTGGQNWPGQATDLGSRVFGVTPEVFERALLRDLPRWETDARLDMAGLQSALKVQETMGLLTADLSLDEMVSQL